MTEPQNATDVPWKVQVMARAANDDSRYQVRCREGEKVFYVADSKGRMPGHIYSPAGEREFNISGYCEYHFDEITKED